MEPSNVLKRIHEHRVNIAYTKEGYYNAYFRITAENKKKLKQRTLLFNLSTAISIITLSGLIVHLANDNQRVFLITSAVFSSLTVFLSIYLSSLTEIKDPFEYLQRAEGFNVLYKHIKTLEAQIKDGCVEDNCELNTKLEKIDEKIKILYTNPLPTEYADYQAAKNNIQNGNLSYTDEELQNT